MRFSIFMAILTAMLFSVNIGRCQERAPVLKENTFIMAFVNKKDDYLGKWWRMTYTEIFRRLGAGAEFREYPPKRASMEADAGNIDGEAARIYSYIDDHPNLIRVEESVFTINISAFTAKDSIPLLKGWESLKGKDYKVEYEKGIKISEINLPKVVKRENLSDITDKLRALKKLASGRTDLFVEAESNILLLLQQPELKNTKIRNTGVMEAILLYPYLHKKHAALAPKMAEIIKAMKAEGLIEQYRVLVDKEFGFVKK